LYRACPPSRCPSSALRGLLPTPSCPAPLPLSPAAGEGGAGGYPGSSGDGEGEQGGSSSLGGCMSDKGAVRGYKWPGDTLPCITRSC